MADVKLSLTLPQLEVLSTAIGFLEAGEWSETISAGQRHSLLAAQSKIHNAIAMASKKPKKGRNNA